MVHDVFLSCSSKDKPVAEAACAVLEARGIRCWIAPRDISPGADWGDAIIHAIAESRLVVLFFSESANTSPQIKREVERSVNRGIPIIPVRVEDVQPSGAMEYFISTPHWLDAFPAPLEPHLEYLADVVSATLKGAQLPPAAKRAALLRRPPQAFYTYGAIAALLLGLLLAGWWFLLRPAPEVQFGPECLVVVEEPSAKVCPELRQHIAQWQSCSSQFATQDMAVALRKARSMIDNGLPASALYFGPQFYGKAFGTISHYWEKLGQCVDENYTPLDQLSGVAFPLYFWNCTHALRQLFRDNWSGQNIELPNFMSNFQQLCLRFKAQREALKRGAGKVFNCNI